MKIKKNKLLGIGVFLISILLILSSGVSMANKADIDYQVKIDFKKVVTGSSSSSRITCYASNLHNDPNDNLVSFYSDIPGTLTNIAEVLSDNYLMGGCFAKDIWWACEYSDTDNSNIWEVDETCGAMYLIGNSGVGLTGLAYDNVTDTLYGCSSENLFIINQANGAASLVGPFNTGGLMVGIACDINGKMYGEDSGTDSLYEINTATGTASLIGALGIDLNDAQDIGYDKDNNILYSTGYKGSTTGGAFGTLDLNDGHYTYINDFPDGIEGCPSQVACLAIPYNVPNDRPDKPEIGGPLQGPHHKEICWTFNSSDPNGDKVKYNITWGDKTPSTETDYNPCDTPVTECHTYTPLIGQGKYTITARAIDEKGLTSENATLKVSIPRSRAVYHPLLLRLFERFPNAFLILRALLEI